MRSAGRTITVLGGRSWTARDIPVPLLAMVSYSIVFRRGPRRFLEEVRAAGIEGLIVPDLAFEEAEELAALGRACDCPLVLIVAPTTTPDRRRRIAAGIDALATDDAGSDLVAEGGDGVARRLAVGPPRDLVRQGEAERQKIVDAALKYKVEDDAKSTEKREEREFARLLEVVWCGARSNHGQSGDGIGGGSFRLVERAR